MRQAQFMLEYALYVGKRTPANARVMKAAMNQLYGETKAQKIFSLADYFRLEGMRKGVEKGKQEGKIEGMRKGVEKGIFMLAAELKKAGVSEDIIERAVHQQKAAIKS